jgi:hypothetical protein
MRVIGCIVHFKEGYFTLSGECHIFEINFCQQMESKDTIVIALVVAVAAASIYKKYIKKNQPGQGEVKPRQNSFGQGTSDDYEPYSGK